MSSEPGSSGSTSRIVLRVPASGRYLDLLRTAVGRMARLGDFTFDGIEDIALAVDEAAVLLLDFDPAELELTAQLGSAGLSVELRAEGTDGRWPPAGLEHDTRWQVLSTVCEKAWVVEGLHAGIGLMQSTR